MATAAEGQLRLDLEATPKITRYECRCRDCCVRREMAAADANQATAIARRAA